MTVKKISSSDDLVTSADIQVYYEKLYKFLMNYLWEFPVVQDLANLEIAIFKRFPDKEEMLDALHALQRSISYTYTELSEDEDTEFQEAVEDLEQAIEDFDEENTGCELYSVEEVIDMPHPVSSAEEINMPNGKKKFKIGNIKRVTKEERELQEEAARTLSNPFENTEEEEQ